MKRKIGFCLAIMLVLAMAIGTYAKDGKSGVINTSIKRFNSGINLKPTTNEIEATKIKDIGVDKYIRALKEIRGNEYQRVVSLNAPHYRQETSYYCAPACVQMLDGYFNRRPLYSQDFYANKMGTTSDSGTFIENVLNAVNLYANNTDIEYIISEIGDYERWFNRIIASIERDDRPIIIDINTYGINSFSYNTTGHYVVIAGFDTRYGEKVLVLDPNGGRRWYDAMDVYRANNQHHLRKMIW